MSERVNDERINDLELYLGEEIDEHLEHDGGVGLSVPNARAVVAALAELRQHRARIVVHATAHPERLSDDDLESLLYHGCSSGTSTPPKVREAIVKATAEIQQRRAADLTPEELDALRMATTLFATSERIERLAESALEKLRRAHGARP